MKNNISLLHPSPPNILPKIPLLQHPQLLPSSGILHSSFLFILYSMQNGKNVLQYRVTELNLLLFIGFITKKPKFLLRIDCFYEE